jgi:hypothetical protein
MPDFLALVDGLPDFLKSPPVPEVPEPPASEMVALDPARLLPNAPDIGSAFYDEKSLWGNDVNE